MPMTKLSIKSGIIVLLVSGLFFQSCKKSAPKQNVDPDSTTKPTQQIEDSADEKIKLVPLNIKLPHSVFVGTKIDVKVPDLDPSTNLREPFFAPEGTINVARNKPVVSNQEPIIADLTIVTDGDKEAADGSFVEFGPGLTYITIDLQEQFEIYAIVVWHYHQQQQAYFDTIVQVSDDPKFIKDVKTLFNNDRDNSAGQGIGSDLNYMDTYEGKLIDAKGTKAQYVRLYSNGNSLSELNHYVEVEVYGKAAK